jgi:SAM-dependent methyltransferase
MERDGATPSEQLARALDGYLTTQLIYVAAKLGIAERLSDGPMDASQLAAVVGAEPATLRRVLRGLVVEDVLAEDADGRFVLTPVGECLPAYRGAALARGEVYSSAAAGLLDSVLDGGTPFERVYEQRFFDHLDGHAEHQAAFDASMAGRAEREAAAVVAAYDFGWGHTVVDVGGGSGVLLAAVLADEHDVEGVLVDRPASIEAARAHLEAVGLADRVRCSTGDFFAAVPRGGDIYVLSRILHDWDDHDARRILTTCRDAMEPGSRLVIVDTVLPERADECPAAVRLDLNMLLLFGSRERTEDEFRSLLAASGFALHRVLPTALPARLSVIEATPV